MIPLNFEHIRQYVDLSAVPWLEDNVRRVFNDISRLAMGKLKPTSLKVSTYAAAIGDLVIANGTFSVTLPAAKALNNGEVVGIVVQAGVVTAKSISNVQGVSGATGDALATAGLYLYESTGVDWWRAPLSAGGGGVSSVTAADTSLTISPTSGAVVAAVSAAYTAAILASIAAVDARTVAAGAGLTGGGAISGNPTINAVAGDATIVVSADSFKVGTISSTNIDSTVATASSVTDADVSIGNVLDALRFQTRVLRSIDEKVAARAGRLPFSGDDDGDTMQLMTSLLISIDNHLADETGTLPFSED